jgi:hypothetical protein
MCPLPLLLTPDVPFTLALVLHITASPSVAHDAAGMRSVLLFFHSFTAFTPRHIRVRRMDTQALHALHNPASADTLLPNR